MDVPLGRTAGNWLEVVESVECLENRGPADLRQLVLDCAGHLLRLTGRAVDLNEGIERAADALAGGGPLRRWETMLEAQGSDLAAYRAKLAAGPQAHTVVEVVATEPGFVADVDAKGIGEVVRDLGGGRLAKGDTLDLHVGIDRLAVPGQAVETGSTLARVHARSRAEAEAALERVRRAFRVAAAPVQGP
jgi:thymidine phosphorylase